KVSGGLLLSKVPFEIVDSFMRDFENHPDSVLSSTDPIRRYIGDRRHDEMDEWDVLITSLRPELETDRLDLDGWTIVPINRSIGADDLSRGILSIGGSSSRVASRGMERAGLSDTLIELAEGDYRKEKGLLPDAKVNYPDRIYRARRERPLFILFNVRIKKGDDLKDEDLARIPDEPVVGWGMSFPVSGRPDQKVEYILNTTKLRELFGEDDQD